MAVGDVRYVDRHQAGDYYNEINGLMFHQWWTVPGWYYFGSEIRGPYGSEPEARQAGVDLDG